MGRGDNEDKLPVIPRKNPFRQEILSKEEANLLFNPPKGRIKRPRKKESDWITFERSGSIFRPSPDFFAGEDFFILRDRGRGTLTFFNQDFQEVRAREQNITDDALLVVSGQKMAWGEFDGFALRQFDNPENPLAFRQGTGERVLDLHLTDNYLYCLHSSFGQARLQRLALDEFENTSVEWETIEEIESPLKTVKRGGKTVFWLASAREESGRLMTLDEKGFLTTLELEGSEQALLDDKKQPLITPTSVRNEYYLISSNDNGPILNVLRENSLSGVAEEGTIDNLNDHLENGDRVKDILWHRSNGFILSEREIFLFSEEGIRQSWSLRGSSYDRIMPGKSGITLQAHDGRYQEISFEEIIRLLDPEE